MGQKTEVALNSGDVANGKNERGRSDFTDVYKELVQLQQRDKDSVQRTADIADLNSRLHQQGLLPDTQITGADQSNHLLAMRDGKQVSINASDISDGFQPKPADHSWLQGMKNVGIQIGKGAWDEVSQHPGRVVEDAAIGLAIGAAGAFVAPEVALVVAGAGLAYAGVKLAQSIPGLAHDAQVVANPQGYSQNELLAAKNGIGNIGATTVDLAAGIAGGYAGSYLGSAIKAGLTAGVPEGATSGSSKTNSGASTVTDTNATTGKIDNASQSQVHTEKVSGGITHDDVKIAREDAADRVARWREEEGDIRHAMSGAGWLN